MIERVKIRRALPLPEVPLLVTELAEDFERLRDDLEQEIKPRGAIERIYVQDVASIVWDILRLRRCKTVIINTRFRAALERLLDQLLSGTDLEDSLEELAIDWFTDPKAKKRVAELLGMFELDEFAIEAEAMRELAPTLETIERMLSSLELRRDRALYHVPEYRLSLSHQLRESTNNIIDGKALSALERASGKSSAA